MSIFSDTYDVNSPFIVNGKIGQKAVYRTKTKCIISATWSSYFSALSRSGVVYFPYCCKIADVQAHNATCHQLFSAIFMWSAIFKWLLTCFLFSGDPMEPPMTPGMGDSRPHFENHCIIINLFKLCLLDFSKKHIRCQDMKKSYITGFSNPTLEKEINSYFLRTTALYDHLVSYTNFKYNLNCEIYTLSRAQPWVRVLIKCFLIVFV